MAQRDEGLSTDSSRDEFVDNLGPDPGKRILTTETQSHGGGLGFKALSPGMRALSGAVVHAAFRVHKTLGPGLLESVYDRCLRHELACRGVAFQSQLSLPVLYGGVRIDAGLRLDLIVDERIVVELKAVECLHPIHTAQLLTYLKLTGLRVGLLINFNAALIKDGIKRIVH